MKIKFNWGTGIFLVIILFMLAAALAIHFALRQKINLVTEDYYPKVLKYQDVIDKKKNVAFYQKQIILEEDNKQLIFTFPDSIIADSTKGKIHFYRPSDFEMDIIVDIVLNDSLQQFFEKDQLIRGKYNIFVDWKFGAREYFQELSVFIK